MAKVIPVLVLIALVITGLVWFRELTRQDPGKSPLTDGTGSQSTQVDPKEVERDLIRDRVAALVSKGEFAAARAALAPLVDSEEATQRDLLWAAVIELKDLQGDEVTRPLVERARALDPTSPAVAFLEGRLADINGDFETAIERYRACLAAAPDDPGAKFLLAIDLDITDEDGTRLEEAVDLFRQIEALGLEEGGPWYVSAVYRLYQSYASGFLEDPEAERRYQALWDALSLQGLKALRDEDYNEGELARILPPAPRGNHAEGAVTPPTCSEAGTLAESLGGAAELLALDLDGDRQIDLATAGEGGVQVALRDPSNGSWREPLAISSRPARLLHAIDLDQDDTLDLLWVEENRLVLYRCEGELGAESWTPSKLELPAPPGEVGEIELLDYDHDGDLDILVAAGSAMLLRNDGAGRSEDQPSEERGSFTDVSAELGWDELEGLRWCAIEDLDGDQDVDLLLGGEKALHVYSNLRGGEFEEVTQSAFGSARFPAKPLLLDADGDARPDALVAGAPARLYLQGKEGSFVPHDLPTELPEEAHPIEVDIDLDGRVDALWATPDGAAAGILALGGDSPQPLLLAPGKVSGPLAVADITPFREALSSPPTYELLRLSEGGVRLFELADVGHGIRLRWRGKKDNRQAIGAVVELRAGPIYRRQFYRGRTTIYGLGEHTYADVVRVRWPNGVVQNEVDVEAGAQILDDSLGEQKEGLIGSCPFLYTWNGETFTFISDVLGITPLGLPMAPGMLVPPDHDEYVLVRGDQLVPDAQEELQLQFTEELREVTYLDRIRLDVVDHPAGSEVQPNERFTFPPFPEPHTHVMGRILSPKRARGSDGKDWTEALGAVDDHYAAPFEPLDEAQFLGLAEPHWLELAFDPEAIAGETRLRLVATGWFYWTDASVNVASARTPGVEFVPPVIEVPFEGGWRPIGPPVGFPAGKTKSMVIDLAGKLDPSDPRLRIGSSLRLYWDALRLAVGPDQPQRTTSLEPLSARLWPRGFSAPLPPTQPNQPERFEWDRLTPRARWNQHPGNYTRFGEVLPLVNAVDDRFCVLGSGDALSVRFDAASLPPLPEGWTRDYLVFLDGWAKDRDPNTVEALEVEPLPFHGMSGYPYGAEESFPDTEETRAWRAQWQTRPAFEGVVPLSPKRFEEWCAAQTLGQ